MAVPARRHRGLCFHRRRCKYERGAHPCPQPAPGCAGGARGAAPRLSDGVRVTPCGHLSLGSSRPKEQSWGERVAGSCSRGILSSRLCKVVLLWLGEEEEAHLGSKGSLSLPWASASPEALEVYPRSLTDASNSFFPCSCPIILFFLPVAAQLVTNWV